MHVQGRVRGRHTPTPCPHHQLRQHMFLMDLLTRSLLIIAYRFCAPHAPNLTLWLYSTPDSDKFKPSLAGGGCSRHSNRLANKSACESRSKVEKMWKVDMDEKCVINCGLSEVLPPPKGCDAWEIRGYNLEFIFLEFLMVSLLFLWVIDFLCVFCVDWELWGWWMRRRVVRRRWKSPPSACALCNNQEVFISMDFLCFFGWLYRGRKLQRWV